MRTFTLLFAALTIAACGGSDSKTADAKPATIDANGSTPDAPGGTPDAPGAGLTGLGQKCTPGQTGECPSNASECVALSQSGPGWCTPLCLEGATAMTNAQGQFASTTPAPDNSKCAAAFSGSVGQPACGIVMSWTPADNPTKPNTTYTGVSMGCAVVCGNGNACPSGMSAMTVGQSCLCFPQ